MAHFQMITRNTAKIFSTSTCEKCGCVCEAPNTITTHETARTLRGMGFTKVVCPPQEIAWCTALGMAVCHDCYEDEKPVHSCRKCGNKATGIGRHYYIKVVGPTDQRIYTKKFWVCKKHFTWYLTWYLCDESHLVVYKQLVVVQT